MESATDQPKPPTTGAPPPPPPTTVTAMPEQGDKPLFEERFADQIRTIRVALQRYKRW
jgi:hypothetical protein